jgi:hypothetical protein
MKETRALGEIEGRSSGGDWFWTRLFKRLSRTGHLRRLAALPPEERRTRGCLVGRARLVGEPVEATYSHVSCIACWARWHTDSDGGGSRNSAIADFALDCDDGSTAMISARDAVFVVHVDELRVVDRPALGIAAEETTIQPGDRVVVWGSIHTGPGNDPFRATLHVGRRGTKPIWVGLLEPPSP